MLRLCLLALSFASAAATNAAGQKFLDENKNKEGVVTLPSGLQYKVLRSGDGDSHPTADSSCECHYEGRTAQEYIKSPKGETFDSSYARGQPTTFAPRQVIAAWTEAMQKMKVGSKWELVCPPEIAYGGRAMGSDIPANSVLVFTMEMLSCQGVSAEL